MADVKISNLPAATTPLAGTEEIPLVQSGVTKKATVDDIVAAAGSVTDVTATSPVVSSGGATPNISMPAASGSTSGYLTSTDWNTFNSKGSGTVTSVTGTSPIVSSGGTTPAISIPAAGASTSGYLTSTDWNTFNNKQPAGSYLTSGGPLGTPSSGTATNLTGLPLTTGVTGVLPVANGGSGTATPSLVAGTNVTISGTWPNQTINATGGGGSGDVVGPSSATDNAIARFDGTTGKLIQNSGVQINDSGEINVGVWKGTEVGIPYGGTGASTASQARGNLLPSYTGNSGKVLAVNTGATDVEWVAAGGVGTVTSVDMSGGTTGLTTSGGPITGSGTITLAGTLAVTNGGTGATTAGTARSNLGAAASGANSDITSMSGITGAIGTADYVAFDTTYATTLAAGQLGWNGNDTLGLGMAGGNVVQHIGEDGFYYIKATSTITKGQVVMFTGAVGASGVPTGAPATGVTDGSYIMGVAAEGIATNAFGLVQFQGTLRNVNTTGFADGDILWYDPAVTGGLTKTKPSAPNVKVQIAATINGGSAGGGTILIRVSPGSVLGGTDSNVQFGTLANGDLIQYNSAGGYWQNVPATTAAVTTISGGTTGLTPASATAGAVTLGGTLATTNGGTGLTSFTANGVVYASSTSALTTGSALTFDGTLFQNSQSSAASGLLLNLQNTTTGSYMQFAMPGVANVRFGSPNADAFVWQTFGSGSYPEQMRLTSTGLGIGTSSPVTKLQVAGDIATNISQAINWNLYSSGGDKYIGNGYAFQMYFDATGAWRLLNASQNSGGAGAAASLTERMRLDSSGNLGLGVTPSAWTAYKAFQINTVGAFAATTGQTAVGNNWYYDSGDKYLATGNATLYAQQTGRHEWYTAPSGTAGNAISFTQAMTLDASGRVQIGTTTAGGMLTVVAPASTQYGSFDAPTSGWAYTIYKYNGTAYGYLGQGSGIVSGGSATDLALQSVNNLVFATGGSTERARITSSGTWQLSSDYQEGVVTANTGTAYTISLAIGTLQILTLTGNCTFTFPTATAGKSFTLFLKQDATGSRTVTWDSSVKWPSSTAPTITATASKGDKYVFTADGTYWWGSVAGQNYL